MADQLSAIVTILTKPASRRYKQYKYIQMDKTTLEITANKRIRNKNNSKTNYPNRQHIHKKLPSGITGLDHTHREDGWRQWERREGGKETE